MVFFGESGLGRAVGRNGVSSLKPLATDPFLMGFPRRAVF